MRIDLITAVPELVESPLAHSIVGRARESGVVEIHVHDLREHGKGRYRQIDAAPYGGGGGMVLTPEPLAECLEAVIAEGDAPDEVLFLTPDGEVLDQPLANGLSLKKRIVLVAGHYKGIDQRIRDLFVTREVSIGDYVLSGGELPALVLIDALVRILPGAISDAQSALSDSFQDGLLDAPAYTRPAEFRGLAVPDVLRSGDHAAIDAWRERQRLDKTRQRRPDLRLRRPQHFYFPARDRPSPSASGGPAKNRLRRPAHPSGPFHPRTLRAAPPRPNPDMATDLMSLVEATQLRDDHPEFHPGDTIRVHVRVIEGEKERIQIFEGVVIAIQNSGTSRTFTVRKISNGVGVERVFPFASPRIARIERVREGRVRRAKLYYLRGLRGKAARIKEKRRDASR